MFGTLARSALAASLLIACARTPNPATEPAPSAAAQPAAPAFDPVGTFSFAADVEGTTRGGTLEIRRNDQGSLVGTVHSDEGSVPLDAVAVEGRTMRVTFAMPDGTGVVFLLQFQGDDYTGSWSAQGYSGPLSGSRRRG